ncbi:unnamed protein product [Ranitomeya imitator]|uniref:Reverse transcriptase domain-containing protein n=1 Tax=Ranitomeya imitator TaxID=111125 RepID=A0ABN9MMP6_9NEOB|nr:unnamed protein product [Ranitomeya imitator]
MTEYDDKEHIKSSRPQERSKAQIQHWNIDKEQGRQNQVELNNKAANELTRTPEGGSPEAAVPLVTTGVNSATEFTTEDTYYVQCQGTAMGSNVAPAYANAYMNSFEESFVYTDVRYKKHIDCYLRYIDDIFFIWTGPTNTLQAFFQTLNSIYPELEFTIHYDPNQISFLDTLVRKDDQGLLSTDLFSKPMDCNSLLHYSSSHPKATRNSLPRSRFTRVARIVSDPDILPTRLDNMSQKFRERNYPQRLLNQEKIRVLQPQSPSPGYTNEKRVPFIHTFHPFMPKVERVINKHWPLLKKAYPNIPSFSTPPLMCNKRAPNIKDKLVRADIGSLRPTTTQTLLTPHRLGTFPCLNCASCSNIIKSDSMRHPRTGKTYRIRGYYTCNSNFVVYVIKCPCGLLYVGEATQHIKDHIASHKSTIRCSKTWLPIPEHFIKCRHTVAHLKYQVIEQVPRPRRGGNYIRQLKMRETFWIHKLETLSPKGLNREIDWLL